MPLRYSRQEAKNVAVQLTKGPQNHPNSSIDIILAPKSPLKVPQYLIFHHQLSPTDQMETLTRNSKITQIESGKTTVFFVSQNF